MKNLIFICLLAMVLAQQVQYTNRCNDCGQLKSQNDCEQEVTVTGACEWVAASGTTAAKCQKKTTVDPVASFKPYCELVDKPEANCAKTFGCAYVDSKCTHFTGCPAYVKTTTTDCQAISYFCVSDGNACIEAKECKAYTQQQCESTPSISGILKCKWDTTAGACRDYACSEADATLNTDTKCSDWLAGCVTKGQGCVNAPRPACATYTGDDAACQSFIGSDGNCELATGTTNCKAKECANAPTSLASDDDCKAYQKGCITTGKGCVLATTKPLCSTYSGDNTTCVGYLGSDGVCEGDAGGSKCRARKCENGAFNTDELCKQYQSSCKTNGKTCVSALSACNTYKGTATTCAVYIGTDGYCKGTSTTTEASCAPKVCDEAPDTTTTDDACAKYQVGCVTTGKGCVTKANLKSCTSYDGDTTSCQSRVGTEGKCTWKSGTKCVARDCASAASNVNTNPLCANYFTNCVTTGSGCVSQTTCDATVKQQSCEGTNNCSWQPICTSNTACSDYKKKSICLANQARIKTQDGVDDQGNPKYIYVTGKCGWLNNACKDLACSDLTGAYYNTDANCAAELSTCISNRVDACITKYDCSKLLGTQSTCLSYPGYCTNVASATDTTPCVSRKCADNTDATDNATCATFLPGCISSGKGCVDYTTPCTSMKGTQENCNKLFAYKSGSSTNFTTYQCYNSASATDSDFCKVKTCKLAENQTDGSCGSFLDGCVYNGNAGCVDPKAADTTCASYTGVAAFCESAIVGTNSSKYCFGTATSGACKTRECTDNTTATKDEDCEAFLTGCIAKSEGGCVAKSARQCAAQTGTVATCPNFSGGLSPSWTKVACTRYDTCADRVCSDKASPSQASDCTDYKSTCRFLKAGAPCIDAGLCTSYSTPDTATTDQQKFDYCTTIKDNSGYVCGWASGTKCAVRTCDQFLSTFTTSLTCVTYLQKGVSSAAADTCKLAGTFCYLPNKANCDYAFPTGITTDAQKLTQSRIKTQDGVDDQGNPKYIYVTGKCGWLNNACKDLACSDLTGAYYNTDANCAAELSTCISNRVDACITKYDCSKLLGTQSTCLSYPGYCTNVASATDTTPCVSRKCADNTDATDNATCATFLPGCISSGKGCVDYTTPCTSMKGTQENCNKLFAYKSGSSTNFTTYQCYNSASATDSDFCKVKTCKLAENQTDGSCGSFLDGCVYNGNAGCVDPKAADTTCASYTGVAAFCESAIVGTNSSKYCFGTATSGACKTRECTDNTTATKDEDCEAFLTGCIAKSEGGCVAKSARQCAAQTGTVATCPNFSGGLSPSWTKVACTRYDTCADRVCSDKASPSQASDCTDYKSTCRFLKAGAPCIDAGLCTSYSTPDTATTDQQKFDYCTTIKDNSGYVCGWASGTKCAVRTCDQFLSTFTTSLTCVTYLQKGVSSAAADTCKLAGTFCYLPNKANCDYAFPTGITTDAQKLTQCQKYVNISGVFCSFKTGDATCTQQDKCEKLVSQTSAQVCNDVLGYSNGICQKVSNTGCLSTVAACGSYTLDSSLSDANKKAACESLKLVNDVTKFGLGTATYTGCTWSTGNTCTAYTCATISSATSQKDCDSKFSGCYYYAGKCYAAVAAGSCPTVFPSDADTDTKKANYCKSVYETTKGYCEIKADGTGCQTPANADCVLTLSSAWTKATFDGATPTTDAFCITQSIKDKTKYCIKDDAAKCKAGTCENITATSQNDCDLHLTGCVFSAGKCRTPKGGISVVGDCADTSKLPFTDATGLAGSAKTAYCQIFSKDGATVFCTYDEFHATTQTACVAAGNCDSYTTLPAGDAARQTYCLSKINSTGKKCGFTAGAAKCRDFDCQDIASPTSQVDCDLQANSLKCVYYKGTCVNDDNTCDKVPAVGTSADDKRSYCAGTSLADTCTYAVGTYCVKQDTCDTYDVTDATDKAAACGALSDGTNKCTFIQGTKCVTVDICSKYDGTTTAALGPASGSEEAQCKAVKSKTNYPCMKDADKKCKAQACTDNDASATDCANNAPDCIYYSSKCISKDTCANYTAQGSDDAAKQTWCEGVANSSGDLCAWDSTNKKCKDRVCGDKQFYTDFDCSSYLKSCKTNGQTCVTSTTQCNSLNGSTEFCNLLLDTTGKDRCKPLAPASPTAAGACTNKQCYDNVTATSDSECDSYLSGCVTRGTGCIPNTEQCTSYRGTKLQCEQFKRYTGLDANKNPTYEYCSGDASNTATGKCKVRTCADNTTATSDTDCAAYLKGCITKGTGCIDATSSCSGFKGDQATCAKFMASSGKDYCWNTSTALVTAACAKKKCSDIAGKNNKDCNDGMPPFKATDDPFCVYDGTGCIDYGKNCSTFNGTEETCPTYLAKDGPCKATTVGTIKGACAKRVCTEAPNTLATDADCQKYHKDCYTTGYGCSSVKNCSNLTSQAACKLRAECTWANQCTASITTCATYSNTSYSQCTNSKVNGKFCAWTESNSTCRAQTCEDQPATIASHAQCQSFADTCTTSGAGCLTITTCASYKTQSICIAASTTKDGVGRCGWDTATNKCRARVCGDKNGLTDDECNTFLAGCKTNGQSCVTGTSCTEFSNKQFCIKSNYGPCLWVNGSCYDYDRCEDAIKKTHSECQGFSPLCTTNGDTCIPITNCASTTLKASCVVGTDGACGWLPTGKCQKFGQCTDAVAATNDECLSYGPTSTSDSECDSYLSGCVTRGTGCIPNTEQCTSYRGTKLQCEQFKRYTGLDANKNPTYEYCSGDASNTATGKCKVRTCADNTTATSDTDCAAYLKGCITKGTGCIDATSSCSGFKGDQATCAKFMASSGKDYCWNTSTALVTAACAKKKCSDIAGKNNKDCNDGMPPFKATDDPFCVYDGTGCIDYGKNCSTFNGTEETCPTYLAKDGPCKATTVGTIKGACAKRVCTEAPNTLATDADCQKYHKDCYTTGYGCSSVKNCSNLTSQAACKLRAECTWANQCTASITTCATYSNTSYSQCTNSKVNGKFCAWTESNSTCRAQTCEDQPATIASHAQCQSFADTCTTSGAGCLTITTCASYKTQSICIAASTTKDGVGRCGWDTATNKCRARVCGDKNGLTDDECNTFLAGCKTNGQSCVTGTSCTEFSNKQFCIKSNYGPCLWVNGSCYDYDRCEDAIKKTHSECQGFSPLCTTNGDTCIPITNCASTTLKASCVVGTDGACGWLPTGKCQKFGQCTDAVAATNDECLSYGPTCITDGTACIAKAACATYKTQTACNNLGTDGICYWNATANTCKLKECGDEQKGTNDQCKLISVTGGSCTTDGTKCIPYAACSSYVEAGCFYGTDGECIFALPVGATTGTKACRQKQCEDITGGTSNANCMGVITGKACVSNGTSCIAKAACSTYKTITSCNGGGLENSKSTVCAFTPTGTDKVNGTCKTFTACADATKDKLACTTNPTCKWTENSTGTNCANHACDTFATGTDCQPIPSFDGTSSTVCVLQSGKCAAADPGTMTDSKICYTKSAYTYSWNAATNKCESCISGSVNPNNSNGTNNNTDNGTTTTDSAYILSVISLGLLGLMA
ncbi:unnamed protein product [Paramecium octaurelia]|uniref:PSI domain-containing protein n=2 Tax=Paramecium octaurelia TaxID=43137 RepID=A0A8S1YFD5_PAROT|nr:unnamed protein product [Paramecium octaurelia]